MLAKLDRRKELALLCINDEVSRDHDRITTYFREWQDRHWGTPAAWESDVARHQRRADEEFRIRGLGSS